MSDKKILNAKEFANRMKLLELVVSGSAQELTRINKEIIELYNEETQEDINKKYRELSERRNILESSLISSLREVNRLSQVRPFTGKEKLS